MKGLQDRNNLLLDGRTVENKGKLIHLGYFENFDLRNFLASNPVSTTTNTYISNDTTAHFGLGGYQDFLPLVII